MTDTSPAAAHVQLEVLRRLSAERRLTLAVEMSLAARALLMARLRTEHPSWSAEERSREALRLTLPGKVLPPRCR
jgi:hypothetical protein